MNNLRKDIFMLNKNSIQPLYKQLMDIITQQIKNGTYKPGEKIPPEPELADLYQVSRITVRRTVEELCTQGYLIKHQGKGTFVKSPMIFRKFESQKNMSFSESCRQNDRIPESHVLSFCKKTANSVTSDFLQLTSDEEVFFLERLLLADSIPVIDVHTWLPTRLFPDFDPNAVENGSFFDNYITLEYKKTESFLKNLLKILLKNSPSLSSQSLFFCCSAMFSLFISNKSAVDFPNILKNIEKFYRTLF